MDGTLEQILDHEDVLNYLIEIKETGSQSQFTALSKARGLKSFSNEIQSQFLALIGEMFGVSYVNTHKKTFFDVWSNCRANGDFDALSEMLSSSHQSLDVKHNSYPEGLLLFHIANFLSRKNEKVLSRNIMEVALQKSTTVIERLTIIKAIGFSHGSKLSGCVVQLPDDLQKIGYYLVRAAELHILSDELEKCFELLKPIAENFVPVGAYDAHASAIILDRLGNKDDASKLLRLAEKLGQQDNGFMRLLGNYHLNEKGDVDAAINHFQKSLALDYSWSSTHFDIAGAYRVKGCPAEELQHLEQIKHLSFKKDVNYEYVDKRLKQLGKHVGS